MSPRRRYAVAVLLLVSLLVGTVLLIDVQLMTSTLASDSSVGTSRVGDAEAPTDLTLVVLGEGDLDDLETAIEAALAPQFDEIRLATEPDGATGPVLVVAFSAATIRYNPVTPTGHWRADFALVGSGNATLATAIATGTGRTVLTNEDPYVIEGTVSVTDRSRGLVSVPGYRSHLRGALADELVRAIGSAPGME
jgi:hypothetical protein